MAALLGVTAVFVALLFLGKRARALRAAVRGSGGTPETAIAIANFGEIDDAIAGQRCECRGRFLLRGEGPVAAYDQLRQVHIECRECGRDRRLFFDLTQTDGGRF